MKDLLMKLPVEPIKYFHRVLKYSMDKITLGDYLSKAFSPPDEVFVNQPSGDLPYCLKSLDELDL